MKLNEFIRIRRSELGLTLKDVSSALNVSESTISRYESNNIQNMGIDKIELLSHVLRCNPEYLLSLESSSACVIHMDTISDRIKYALSFRNMNQSDLVKKTGIGKSSISTYISGAYEPKQKNISKIAKALNVNESWLVGYDVPIDSTSNIKDSISPRILTYYNQLNDLGKREAEKRVQELTYIPRYASSSDDALLLNASHADAPEELK